MLGQLPSVEIQASDRYRFGQLIAEEDDGGEALVPQS